MRPPARWPQGVFYRNMGQSDVPYFYFAASMVIGTVFSSYDCGRFLSGVTGEAEPGPWVSFVPETSHGVAASVHQEMHAEALPPVHHHPLASPGWPLSPAASVLALHS